MTSFDQFKHGYFYARDPARGWRISTNRYEPTPVEGVLEQEWAIRPDDSTKRRGSFYVIIDQREHSNNIIKYYITLDPISDGDGFYLYERLFLRFFPGEEWIDCLNYIAKAIVVAKFSEKHRGSKTIPKVYINGSFLRSIEYDCALLEKEENSDYYLLASASEKEILG